MSDSSARLSLPYLAPAQAQKHVTHNEALQLLDAVTQLALQGVEATTPPTTPVLGATYALADSPSGDWSGQAGSIAYWDGTGWIFSSPQEGWHGWDIQAGLLRAYVGGDWVAVGGDLQNISGLGIGTSYDATNRLAVASDATLLSHDGAGHQLKLNKAGETQTASLLFQSNWQGHAEMGLAGGVDFNIKTSDDGANWNEAIEIDAATGRVAFPSGQVPAPDRGYISTVTPQTIVTGQDTAILLDTAVYDTAGFYDPATPGRLQIAEDGGYELNAYAQLQGSISIGAGWISIRRYDSADQLIGTYPMSWITGYTMLTTPMVDCVAGDYFQLVVRQNSGSDMMLLTSDDRNYLSIKRAY